jgi:hypothetical protein
VNQSSASAPGGGERILTGLQCTAGLHNASSLPPAAATSAGLEHVTTCADPWQPLQLTAPRSPWGHQSSTAHPHNTSTRQTAAAAAAAAVAAAVAAAADHRLATFTKPKHPNPRP